MIEYTITGNARSLAEVPDGARINYVNGRCVIATCEGCSRPILEDSVHHEWADGVFTCKQCGGPDREP